LGPWLYLQNLKGFSSIPFALLFAVGNSGSPTATLMLAVPFIWAAYGSTGENIQRQTDAESQHSPIIDREVITTPPPIPGSQKSEQNQQKLDGAITKKKHKTKMNIYLIRTNKQRPYTQGRSDESHRGASEFTLNDMAMVRRLRRRQCHFHKSLRRQADLPSRTNCR